MQTKSTTIAPEIPFGSVRRRWEAPRVIDESEFASNTNTKFNIHTAELHALTTNSIANNS